MLAWQLLSQQLPRSYALVPATGRRRFAGGKPPGPLAAAARQLAGSWGAAALGSSKPKHYCTSVACWGCAGAGVYLYSRCFQSLLRMLQMWPRTRACTLPQRGATRPSPNRAKNCQVNVQRHKTGQHKHLFSFSPRWASSSASCRYEHPKRGRCWPILKWACISTHTLELDCGVWLANLPWVCGCLYKSLSRCFLATAVQVPAPAFETVFCSAYIGVCVCTCC